MDEIRETLKTVRPLTLRICRRPEYDPDAGAQEMLEGMEWHEELEKEISKQRTENAKKLGREIKLFELNKKRKRFDEFDKLRKGKLLELKEAERTHAHIPLGMKVFCQSACA